MGFCFARTGEGVLCALFYTVEEMRERHKCMDFFFLKLLLDVLEK
jgi:hypothetical protein